MSRHTLETDYLVMGAGAAGMAFTDSLISESDADVVLVDRRDAPGGHWNDAYSFVRLHQPSVYYGVNSTPLGTDSIERGELESGWYPRSSAAEIRTYYEHVLYRRLIPTGRVRYFPLSDVAGGNRIVSRLTGETIEVRVRRKVVDAAYLSPSIPAATPPPFEIGDEVSVIPVNDLSRLVRPPEKFVIVGAGKTALDACVWLLRNGVAPAAIQWIKPRECWLLNRAFCQPDALVGTFMRGIALQMEAAANAMSVDDLFDRLERADQIRRVDRSVRPTMFRGATIADWEIDLLRQVQNVIRLGHVRRVDSDRIVLDGGSVPTSRDHLFVHCAVEGLPRPPTVPIFQADRITLQPVRVGLVPFNAAIVAFIEAHRDDDGEKNRLCPPNPFPNTELDWIRGTLIQFAADRAWSREPDIREWLEQVRLNPARGIRTRSGDPEIREASRRFAESVGPGLASLARLIEREAA